MALFSTIAGSALLGTIASTAVSTVGGALINKGAQALVGGNGGGQAQPAARAASSGGGFNINTTAASDSGRTNSGPPAARTANKEEHEAFRDAKMWDQRLRLEDIGK